MEDCSHLKVIGANTGTLNLLINFSFEQCCKSAHVTLTIKKCVHHNDLNHHRPVSNLCFIANILEKMVSTQVSSYLNAHHIFYTFQPAYSSHSTKTALLKVSSLPLTKTECAYYPYLTFCKHLTQLIILSMFYPCGLPYKLLLYFCTMQLKYKKCYFFKVI